MKLSLLLFIRLYIILIPYSFLLYFSLSLTLPSVPSFLQTQVHRRINQAPASDILLSLVQAAPPLTHSFLHFCTRAFALAFFLILGILLLTSLLGNNCISQNCTCKITIVGPCVFLPLLSFFLAFSHLLHFAIYSFIYGPQLHIFYYIKMIKGWKMQPCLWVGYFLYFSFILGKVWCIYLFKEYVCKLIIIPAQTTSLLTNHLSPWLEVYHPSFLLFSLLFFFISPSSLALKRGIGWSHPSLGLMTTSSLILTHPPLRHTHIFVSFLLVPPPPRLSLSLCFTLPSLTSFFDSLMGFFVVFFLASFHS